MPREPRPPGRRLRRADRGLRARRLLLACGLAACCAAGSARAAPRQRVAVLEFESARGLQLDRVYFSDRVRGLIGKRAPQLFVMTRESAEALLEASGKSLGDCEGECEVEVGRRLAADYVVSGRLAAVGRRLTLSLRLHSTADAQLLGSEEAAGQDAEALGDACDAAVTALLAKLPAALRAPARSEPATEGLISEQGRAPQLPGDADVIVRIATEPAGAVALLDGRLLCQATPCSRLISTGRHELSFQKEGWEDHTEPADVRAGLSVSIRLVRTNATLEVETEPPGLPVSLDGQKPAPAPLLLRDVAAGPHELLVDDPCWLRTGERVILKPGEERKVRLAGKPRTAGLKVIAEDERGNAVAARLVVDGQAAGTAPASFAVPSCARQIAAEGEGLAAREPLALEEGKVASLTLRMLPSGSGERAPERVEPKSGLAFVLLPKGVLVPEGGAGRKRKRGEEEAVASFELGKTEVTVEAFLRCVEAGWCAPARKGEGCNGGTDRRDHPINCVSWPQAAGFCAWIGGKLPTSSEWEYAAAGGAEAREYPWGNEPPDDARLQWKAAGTAPVASHPKGDGRWGLHDLAGNVWEWTSTEVGGGAGMRPARKVLRGGGFSRIYPPLVRVRDRSSFDPAFDFGDLGFRCAFDARAAQGKP